jgi:hypothetical protein
MSTCKIRQAENSDYDQVVQIMERFHEWAPFKCDIDKAVLPQVFDYLMTNGVVYIATDDAQCVGAIIGVMSSAWYNPSHRMAVELAWWVDDSRKQTGLGIRLLKHFEQWAKSFNAQTLVFSDFVKDESAPAGQMLERLGYKCFERSFTKTI